MYEEQPHSVGKGKGVYTENYHEFAKVLISYIYKQRVVEDLKVSLIKKADFNLLDSFKLLDWRSQGMLSPSDIL